MDIKIKEFLDRHCLSEESYDIDELCSYKLRQMENGLDGKKSDLAMINSYCSPVDSVNPGEKVIVIDAGGTNLRTCLVSFEEDGSTRIEDFQKTNMPGSKGTLSAKEFFSQIADAVERLIDRSNRIGFCFSYPVEVLSNHDGICLLMTKEISAPEVIGKKIGEELLLELSRRGHKTDDKKLIILNDTVATLLAGISKVAEKGCEGCMGFILGTGTNTAYVEKDTIINEESGNLSFPTGDIDNLFLASTPAPDQYILEKMISGRYLGNGFEFVLRQAAEEGLLSKDCTFENVDTIQLSNFLNGEKSTIHAENKKDMETVKALADAYISRSAKFTAANLAASVLKSGYGKDKPVLINADGSTFYLTPGVCEKTGAYLENYLKSKGRSAVFTRIENSPTIGSAIGALSI